MADDQTPLERWLDALNGRKLPGWDPERSVYRCDYCSETIHPVRKGRERDKHRISHYVSDKVIEPDKGIIKFDRAPFAFLRSYCSDCNRRKVQFPCQGFNELILSSYLRPDGSYDGFKVEHFSGADDGVPWDPREFYNKVHDAADIPGTFEEWLVMAKLGTAAKGQTGQDEAPLISHGPEDVIDHFKVMGVPDPREVVDEDGNATLPEITEEELKQNIMERAKELEHAIGDEKAFNREINPAQ